MQMLAKATQFQMLAAKTQSQSLFIPFQLRCIGKTEDGHKYRTPKLRMRSVKRIPAPGKNLQIPVDLDAETFCKQIGGDCDEIADKFESIDEIFTEDRVSSTLTMKIRSNFNHFSVYIYLNIVLNEGARHSLQATQVSLQVPRAAQSWCANFRVPQPQNSNREVQRLISHNDANLTTTL